MTFHYTHVLFTVRPVFGMLAAQTSVKYEPLAILSVEILCNGLLDLPHLPVGLMSGSAAGFFTDPDTTGVITDYGLVSFVNTRQVCHRCINLVCDLLPHHFPRGERIVCNSTNGIERCPRVE